MRRYACPECPPAQRSVVHYKGLCRECTTYDDAGSVVEAVYRVASDEFGNPVQHIATRNPPVNRAGQIQQPGVRQVRKPTRKQREAGKAHVAKEVDIPIMTDFIAGSEEE